MPIYEYECLKCKRHTEAFQKMSDKPLAKCPRCGGRLEKLFSAPAIQFKGSGWYVTDYASAAKKEAARAESETSSGDDKKSEKTDKKTKDGSPPKKTSEKSSSTKSPTGD